MYSITGIAAHVVTSDLSGFVHTYLQLPRGSFLLSLRTKLHFIPAVQCGKSVDYVKNQHNASHMLFPLNVITEYAQVLWDNTAVSESVPAEVNGRITLYYGTEEYECVTPQREKKNNVKKTPDSRNMIIENTAMGHIEET